MDVAFKSIQNMRIGKKSKMLTLFFFVPKLQFIFFSVDAFFFLRVCVSVLLLLLLFLPLSCFTSIQSTVTCLLFPKFLFFFFFTHFFFLILFLFCSLYMPFKRALQHFRLIILLSIVCYFFLCYFLFE